MHTGMNAFCIKYNIADKAAQAISIADDMIQNHMKSIRPLTFRLTYTELTSETALDFMAEGMTESPFAAGKFPDAIRAQVKDIIQEPTTRGFRIKILI
jgi:hypothetical protein